jgi:tetratricopeptide (TPR) repeat protein
MECETYEEYIERARGLLGAYENADDLWEANDNINSALYLRPFEVGAWILKSQILSSLEDDPAALAAAEMAIRRAPKNAEALYVRAAVLADMGMYEEALRGINRAMRSLGGDDLWLLEDLYYEKASILDALDQVEEAVATLEVGLRRCPDSTLLRSGLDPLKREITRRSFKVIDGGQP